MMRRSAASRSGGAVWDGRTRRVGWELCTSEWPRRGPFPAQRCQLPMGKGVWPQGGDVPLLMLRGEEAAAALPVKDSYEEWREKGAPPSARFDSKDEWPDNSRAPPASAPLELPALLPMSASCRTELAPAQRYGGGLRHPPLAFVA